MYVTQEEREFMIKEEKKNFVRTYLSQRKSRTSIEDLVRTDLSVDVYSSHTGKIVVSVLSKSAIPTDCLEWNGGYHAVRDLETERTSKMEDPILYPICFKLSGDVSRGDLNAFLQVLASKLKLERRLRW